MNLIFQSQKRMNLIFQSQKRIVAHPEKLRLHKMNILLWSQNFTRIFDNSFDVPRQQDDQQDYTRKHKHTQTETYTEQTISTVVGWRSCSACAMMWKTARAQTNAHKHTHYASKLLSL